MQNKFVIKYFLVDLCKDMLLYESYDFDDIYKHFKSVDKTLEYDIVELIVISPSGEEILITSK
jgi:hypothetical protein